MTQYQQIDSSLGSVNHNIPQISLDHSDDNYPLQEEPELQQCPPSPRSLIIQIKSDNCSRSRAPGPWLWWVIRNHHTWNRRKKLYESVWLKIMIMWSSIQPIIVRWTGWTEKKRAWFEIKSVPVSLKWMKDKPIKWDVRFFILKIRLSWQVSVTQLLWNMFSSVIE